MRAYHFSDEVVVPGVLVHESVQGVLPRHLIGKEVDLFGESLEIGVGITL